MLISAITTLLACSQVELWLDAREDTTSTHLLGAPSPGGLGGRDDSHDMRPARTPRAVYVDTHTPSPPPPPPGKDYMLNWSLNRDGVTPRGDAYRFTKAATAVKALEGAEGVSKRGVMGREGGQRLGRVTRGSLGLCRLLKECGMQFIE